MQQGSDCSSPRLVRLFEGGYDALKLALKSVLVVMTLSMSAMITYQVISRYFFNAPSALTEGLLRYALIWLGLLGAGYCFMERRHLNLPLVLDVISPGKAAFLKAINMWLMLIFGAILVWSGYNAVQVNSGMHAPIINISIGALQSVLMFCGILAILAQLVDIGKLISSREISFVRAILALVLIAAFVGAMWQFSKTDFYAYLVDERLELFSVVVLFGLFFILLIIGTPIAIGLVFSGVLTLSLQLDPASMLSTTGEKLFNSLDNFGFLALPCFVLAGNIMTHAGIARRLIDLAMLMGRRIPGNLWQANVIANMLFGCLSGSGIAAATAIGSMVAPIAKEKKYDMPFTTAVNAASAPAGMLIPPSGPFIIYSLISGGSASIVALFLAGYVPGIIMGLSVMIVAYIYARRNKYPTDKSPYKASEVLVTLTRALPSLTLVLVVIGGIVGGVFTAIEGSGVAVFYSLLLALLYRSISFKQLLQACVDTVFASGVILLLIAASGLMSWSMTFASIPDSIGSFLAGISESKYVILVLINIGLLIGGIFMDMSAALLIFTPILFPVVTHMGVDPVHFGVVMMYNLCMGVVTPPVGTVLFVSCGITGEPISRVVKPLLPIFILQIIGLLAITYIPELSLFLPRLFGM
ncbi:TRAP transporter large permease subunit [uncultured Cohaesibacter sp.]|uniref:TRAP transporter large permease n=1 Tax=uncultured Cohaesibacter sp. TaxID=1002546 RepID=UPI002AA82070|nr:TRAP transporter large permease subunit [uncultured Cohaesibacter sp.]